MPLSSLVPANPAPNPNQSPFTPPEIEGPPTPLEALLQQPEPQSLPQSTIEQALARESQLVSPMQPADRRARISGPPLLFTGPLLQRLILTKGLLFPYTPTVIFNRQASYEDFHFTHSNYKYHQFQAGTPGEIQITGEFTAQTNEEAIYMLAAIRFLKSMQLSEFGEASGALRGTPPPILRFNYLGPELFRNVPVVISMANFTFEPGVDYVEVPGFDTWVPVKLMLVTTLQIQPTPERVIREFSVDGFKNGELIRRGYV